MDHIEIIEVGPRDGLQNEKAVLSAALKAEFLNKLSQVGLKRIEAAAFVSPKWIPQMANSLELIQLIKREPHIRYSALIPNLHGLQDAIQAHVNEVAVITAASETFNQKNTNSSIPESLERIREVMNEALPQKIEVRGYISCVAGCPYEGEISIAQVLKVTEKLLEYGIHEISFGDTIGVGTASKMQLLLKALLNIMPASQIAVHFHDTYGQAVSNVFAALELGIRKIDSSVGGLGGCPYAKGATGNVATEDIVYLLKGYGLKTGVDLNALSEIGGWINAQFNRQTRSKTGTAILAKHSQDLSCF